jgi:hypothetical protein
VRRLWCIPGAAVRGGVYVLGYKNGVECNADVRFVLAVERLFHYHVKGE